MLWDFSGAGPAEREPLVLSRHVDRITHLRFHPRQDALATAGEDGMLILWHIPDGDMKELGILKYQLSRLAWNPRGGALAVGAADGEICLFAVA